MGVVAELKERALGNDPAGIAAEIAASRARIEKWRAEARELEAAWVRAPGRKEAEKIEADRRELSRLIERETARLPELEDRLAAARAKALQEAIAQRRQQAHALYLRLRKAIEAAAVVQSEAIAFRDAARAELGESIAARHLPIIAYAGFLFSDLIKIWSDGMERAFSGPPPRPPTQAPRPKPAPAPAAASVRSPRAVAIDPLAEAPQAPTAPPRQPRRDPPPGEGEVQIVILRGEVDLRGRGRATAGDRVNLPESHAWQIVRNGAAEFVGAALAKE